MEEEDCINQIKNRIDLGQGYSVRKSEEALCLLQKENFNLKLKLYFLENKGGSFDALDDEYVNVFLQNQSLKSELNEKKEIMKKALEAIEKLEKEKALYEEKSNSIIEEQLRKIEALKSRTKSFKKSVSRKIQISPNEREKVIKLEEEMNALKSQNADLFSRVNSLKKDLSERVNYIERLSNDNKRLIKEREKTERKIQEFEKTILKLKQELSNDNSVKLQEENQHLRNEVLQIMEKCKKLEKSKNDFERIVLEQSALMKALNRTIEVKNEQLQEIQLKMDFQNNPVKENVIDISGDGNFEKTSKFPFHNPLFGSFSSLYR